MIRTSICQRKSFCKGISSVPRGFDHGKIASSFLVLIWHVAFNCFWDVVIDSDTYLIAVSYCWNIFSRVHLCNATYSHWCEFENNVEMLLLIGIGIVGKPTHFYPKNVIVAFLLMLMLVSSIDIMTRIEPTPLPSISDAIWWYWCTVAG